MNYARSISDEKKAKTIVKGNKSGKVTGSSETCMKNSYINGGIKKTSSMGYKFNVMVYESVLCRRFSYIILFCFIKGN